MVEKPNGKIPKRDHGKNGEKRPNKIKTLWISIVPKRDKQRDHFEAAMNGTYNCNR